VVGGLCGGDFVGRGGGERGLGTGGWGKREGEEWDGDGGEKGGGGEGRERGEGVVGVLEGTGQEPCEGEL